MMAKTAYERHREYLARLKAKKPPKPPPKSGAERNRACRARKRKQQFEKIMQEQQEETQEELDKETLMEKVTPMVRTKPPPKTSLERVRAYRARKKVQALWQKSHGSSNMPLDPSMQQLVVTEVPSTSSSASISNAVINKDSDATLPVYYEITVKEEELPEENLIVKTVKDYRARTKMSALKQQSFVTKEPSTSSAASITNTVMNNEVEKIDSNAKLPVYYEVNVKEEELPKGNSMVGPSDNVTDLSIDVGPKQSAASSRPPQSPSARDEQYRYYNHHDLQGHMSTNNISDYEDEFDVFGTFVATELRGLDISIVRTAKRKILQALLETYQLQPSAMNVNTSVRSPTNLDNVRVKTECPDDDSNTIVS